MGPKAVFRPRDNDIRPVQNELGHSARHGSSKVKRGTILEEARDQVNYRGHVRGRVTKARAEDLGQLKFTNLLHREIEM